MTLTRYILRRFLRALFGTALVICLLVLLVRVVENLRRFAGGEATTADVAAISALQVPELLYQALPLVMLLASLVTFLGLARSSELVVLRAAGLSALRLISIPLAAAAVLGMLSFAALNPLVAVSIREAQAATERFGSSNPNRLSVSRDGLWLRQADPDGQTVIQAARASPDAARLHEVTFYKFDPEGAIVTRIEARDATLQDGAWILADAKRWEIGDGTEFGSAAREGDLRLPTELTRDQILDSFAPPEMLAFWDLPQFIRQLEASGFSGLRHKAFLQSELAKPVVLSAMVLIGAAFALRPARFGQIGVMILLAILAGFTVQFVSDFARSLGQRGDIPLAIAVWAPPAAAILLSLGLLLHLEDG